MAEYEIPRDIENEVIRWAQFDFDQKHTSKKQSDVLGNLPKPLRCCVMWVCAHRHLLLPAPSLVYACVCM